MTDWDTRFQALPDEELKAKFDDMREAEEEWARLKKGPMGTVLPEEELTEEQLTNLEEGV